ncbi:sulfite exporter TauE/SafE family protein [Gleimia europaea]|uniref:Probable membrane transporter protein n=1 Tax=Gleimia europaea ACS-120-V-Col10b TaxID=883069 RepID=A0A9W5RFS4_9ACTO|nr:sulfite exporter TauE/SafE family protein [Gleimia europaea]EPD31599.1 hypothetical protein HMPREF9238_01376 [Gleimia europaea ACS-120-V-Col10b]
MAGFTTGALIVLGLCAFIVGISKTALPGAATLAVALLAAVMPALQSTGVMLLMLLVGDVVAIVMYRKKADWPTLVRLVPGVLLGLVIGAVFLHVASDRVIRVSIGIILLVLIAVTTFVLKRNDNPNVEGPWARAFFGSLAGMTTMAANAGGPVTTMYFLAAKFPVKTFLGTTAWFYFLVNLTKLPFAVALGSVSGESLRVAAPFLPLVLVGALLGRLLATHMSQKVFEPVVTVLTVISAAYLLI